MMGPGGRRTPSGSRDASRDSSRNRRTDSRERSQAEFKEPAPPPAKELTEPEMEKKAKAIMEEYLHLQDMNVRISIIIC